MKKTDTIWAEMVKLENEFKCEYVDDKQLFSEILEYAKEYHLKDYRKLVKFYEAYYGKENQFWDSVEDDEV